VQNKKTKAREIPDAIVHPHRSFFINRFVPMLLNTAYQAAFWLEEL